MDPLLLTKALNFHGQELYRAIEGEQGSEKLRVLDLRNIDYHEYRKRAKEFGFQDRQRRQKLLRFIAKKADVIYKPSEKEETQLSLDSESDELCAVMPALESFMGVPAPERKKHFLENAEICDMAIGQVVRKSDTMSVVFNLICLDGGKKREVIDLGIKLHCQGPFFPPTSQHENVMDLFQLNDYVRVVLTVIPPSMNVGKIVVSMRPDTVPLQFRESVKLGVITEEEIPSHHKRYLINQGKPYIEILEHTLGFNNPATCTHLSKMLGITSDKTYSLMNNLQRLDRSSKDSALNLRKEQSSKWAFKSVRDGVAFFKAGNHTEAFQCLNKALQIDPQNVEAFVARGALFANNNNLRRALEDFDEALSINPNHVNGRKYTSETLVALGRYYEEKGEIEAAFKTYKKSIQINPNNAAGREALIALDMKEKKRQQEKEMLAQRALKVTPPPLAVMAPDTRDKLKLLLKEEKKIKKSRYRRDSESSSPNRSWSSYSPPPGSSRARDRDSVNRSRDRDTLVSPAREREAYALSNQPREKIREKESYAAATSAMHSREKEVYKPDPREKEVYNKNDHREKEVYKAEPASPYWRNEQKQAANDVFNYEEEFEKFEKKLNLKPTVKEDKYFRKESTPPRSYFEEKATTKKRRYSDESPPPPRARSPSPKKEASLRDRIKMFYEKHITLEARHDNALEARHEKAPTRKETRQDSPIETKSKWNFSDDNDSDPNSKGFPKMASKKIKLEEKSRPPVQEVRMASPIERVPSPKVVFVMRKDDDLHYSKIYTHSAFKDEEDEEEKNKKAKAAAAAEKGNADKKENKTKSETKEKSDQKETKKVLSRKDRSYRRDRRSSSSSGDSSDDSSDSSSNSSSDQSGKSKSRKRKSKKSHPDSPYYDKKRKSYDRDEKYYHNRGGDRRTPDKYYEGKGGHYDKYKDGKYRDYKGGYDNYKRYDNDNYHSRGSYRRPFNRRPFRSRGYFRGRRPYFNNRPNSPRFIDKKRGNNPNDDDVVISRAPDIEQLKKLKENRRKEKEGSIEIELPGPKTMKVMNQNYPSDDSKNKSLYAAKEAAKKINESIKIEDVVEGQSPSNGNNAGTKESLKEMESFLEKLKSQKKETV